MGRGRRIGDEVEANPALEGNYTGTRVAERWPRRGVSQIRSWCQDRRNTVTNLGSIRPLCPYAAQFPIALCYLSQELLNSLHLGIYLIRNGKSKAGASPYCREGAEAPATRTRDRHLYLVGEHKLVSQAGVRLSTSMPHNPTTGCDFSCVGAKSRPPAGFGSQGQAAGTPCHRAGTEPGSPEAAMTLTGVCGIPSLHITNPGCPHVPLAKAVIQKEYRVRKEVLNKTVFLCPVS